MQTSQTPPPVDTCDWLKTAAIMMVLVGHTGYFFVYDADWWSVIARTGAPIFFFLIGYAWSKKIPAAWIWLGAILTVLDSWNNDWDWMSANILFSLAAIRLARPSVLRLLNRYGWVAFIALIGALLAVIPFAGNIVDYGAEGWLWALLGLCQRQYLDVSPDDQDTPDWRRMRWLIAPIAAGIYVWQEQLEFHFSTFELGTVMLSVSVLTIALLLFVRGPSRFQPPEPIAGLVRFVGRHTLEIYVAQLAGFELIIALFPHLAA